MKRDLRSRHIRNIIGGMGISILSALLIKFLVYTGQLFIAITLFMFMLFAIFYGGIFPELRAIKNLLEKNAKRTNKKIYRRKKKSKAKV